MSFILKNSRLFRKYNLLFFTRSGEVGLTVHVRGWMFYAALVLVIGLAASASLSVNYYWSYEKLKKSHDSLEAIEREQFAALVRTSYRLRALEGQFSKISDFDYKLRVMLGLVEAGYDEEDETAQPAEFGQQGLAYPAFPLRRNLVRLAYRSYRQVASSLLFEETLQQSVIAEIATLKANWSVIPTIWPTHGRLTSSFGWRRDPSHRGRHFHKGLDISAPVGSKVLAPASGTVIFADWYSSYGRVVEIQHSPSLRTRYAHLHSFVVQPGQFVLRGQIIATTGNSGRSEAPHLHYEVYKNEHEVNPLFYIMDN